MIGKLRAVVIVAAAGAGCAPIAPSSEQSAPMNACPAHPCSDYTRAGVASSCNAGVCSVDAMPKNLVLIVVIPEQTPSLQGGQSFLATFNNASATKWACPATNCVPPSCALPASVSESQAFYLVDRITAEHLNWPTGGIVAEQHIATDLPVSATYRQLYGNPAQDAALLGLPVAPVSSHPETDENPAFLVGPSGGPVVLAITSLETGCYQRTLQPYAPFSTAFPPQISPWTHPYSNDATVVPDTTKEEETQTPNSPIYPTFDIVRADGLDGWTAYLRNITSKQVFSNVAPLSGSKDDNVVLATSYGATDALANLELVIAPPEGVPLPLEVFAPAGLPGHQVLGPQETYAALPTPMTIGGRVMDLEGKPVEADLIFTAVSILTQAGVSYSSNFEFEARATARIDPRSGASRYSVLLPRGDYQIAIAPRDAASAKTVVFRAVGGPGDAIAAEDFVVEALRQLQGSAVIADGRPLAAATVEAVPAQCPSAATPAVVAASQSIVGATPVVDLSAPCIPRSAQTSTGVDGSFTLAVDPGAYFLRVRPADGSGLPWVTRPITVGLASMVVPPLVVPAPVSVGMTLTLTLGPGSGIAIKHAVVRLFTDPLAGPAIEIGRAITDNNGNYEMYLDPAAQSVATASTTSF